MFGVTSLLSILINFIDQAELQNDLLSTLSTRKDLYITSTPLATKRPTREAIALHALNHVTKSVSLTFIILVSNSHLLTLIESAAASLKTTNA